MTHLKWPKRKTKILVVLVVEENISRLSQFYNLKVILTRQLLLTVTRNFVYKSISTNNLVYKIVGR